MSDERDVTEEPARSGGQPGPERTTDAATPGAGMGAPGGAVAGFPGPGAGGGDPGGADLGGDADLGAEPDALRRKTAGGEDSA